MPDKQLALKEEVINKKLKKNAIVTAICTLAGFSMLIPAFSVEGRRFDYQEFCFKPPTVPAGITWCKGKKLKKGIAWKVAAEIENNPEFREKVTFLKTLPAQNPNAGLFGVCGAAFFFAGFCIFMGGTNELEDNLDLVIWNKKAIVLERAFASDQHISIESLRNEQEKEFIADMMNRSHGDAMYSLTNEAEREIASSQYTRGAQLDQAGFELQVATLAAQAAEQAENEAKHKMETAKLNKPAQSSKNTGESCPNEAAKQELIEKLKEHEGGWLHTLVMSNKPIFLIGSQGSWKSYCSASIALCRYYLKNQKLASITDPHFNKNADESWKELIQLESECYGGAQDWADIETGLQSGFERWNKRTLKDEPITSIWDEQTNWILHEECAKSAKEFMGRVISDPRKSNEAVLVITHSFTNAGTGGSSGFAASREEGILQLRLNADNEMKPLFKGKLIGFKDDEGELIDEMKITIPKDWFNPLSICKMFKGN